MSEVLGPLPHRMIISGPSGSGKGILTSEILLKHMKGKFKKYIILVQVRIMMVTCSLCVTIAKNIYIKVVETHACIPIGMTT